MENNGSLSRSAERTRLRTRLVRAMVGTLAVVSGATLLTVGYLNIRIARNTRDTIEAQIRQSITRKGQGLATNHALALRGLVADNAFGDVAQLVESAVRQDHEMVYGLFLGADGRPWTYVPPIENKGEGEEQANWRELGIEPDAGRSPGPESRTRAFKGQMVFEFSASVGSDDGAILGRLFYGLSRVPLDQALAAARRDFQRSLGLTLLLIGGLGIGAMLLGVAIIRNLSRRITEPLAHLTDVITAIAAGHKNERVSIESQDEIGALGRAFNRMLEKLDDSYLRLESLNRTLEQRVNERTEELAHRNRDMRLVLDNVNQGFLTISDRGQLAQEHSAIIDSWFGAYETPLTFWDYMGRRDRGFAEMFELGHEALVEDVLPRQLCLDQLPTRLNLNGRDFSFSYRSIGDDSGEMTGLGAERRAKRGVLIVVNDITEQLLRARHETEQAELLAMFHGFTADRTGFLSFFEEATRLLEALRAGDRRPGHAQAPLSHAQGQRRPGWIRRDRAAVSRGRGQAGRGGRRRCQPGPGGADPALERPADDAVRAGARARARRDRRPRARARRGAARAARRRAARDLGSDGRLAPRAGRAAADAPRRVRALAGAPAGSRRARGVDRVGRPAPRPGALGRALVRAGARDPQRRRPRPGADRGARRGRQAAAPAPAAGDDHRRRSAGDRDRGRRARHRLAGGRARRAAPRVCRATPPRTASNALLSASVTTRDVVTTTSGRGIGLAAVRQRVDSLGGRIALETAPGQGTTFRLTFPLASPSTPEERSVARTAPRANPPAAA